MLCPLPPPHLSLCIFSDFKIGCSALYHLGQCCGLSGLTPAHVPCQAPHVCCFTPAKIPTPASLPQPVPGGQEAGAAGSLVSMVHPEPRERILGESHLSARSLLPFIGEQRISEQLSGGLALVGAHGSLLPHSRQSRVIHRFTWHYLDPGSPSSNVICNFIKV